jgi:MFS family permease
MKATLVALVKERLATSPLRHPPFRAFYAGSIGTAAAYTMQATVAAWLMATLTPSELMVALVQTASTIPTLLFGLGAGALADLVDRRRVILATHVLLLAVTVVLGGAALAGRIDPTTLLVLTFLIGAGFTFYLPAAQASVNDLVTRSELPRAIALGAVAFNVARAVGPALAGALAAWIGTGSALVVAAVFFVPMIVAMRAAKPREFALPGIPETLFAGIRSGLRYVRHSPAMRSLIIRNLGFSTCASALWALLPLIARDQLGMGAGGYGLLFATFGIGAVAGALAIPGQLGRRSLNAVVAFGGVLWALATLLVAITDRPWLALIGTFGAGMAWVTVLASLSAGTQSTAPAWVRARAVAMGLVATQTSLALGSAVWGAIATVAGTRYALMLSAFIAVVLHLLSRRIRVHMGTEADVTTGVRLPDLAVTYEPSPDDGPVLIQIDYQIRPEQRESFLRAVHAVEPSRRRNGAESWRVFRDLGEEGRYVERFIVASWAEFVRLRTRMTVADRELADRVALHQQPGVPIRISRFLGIRPEDVPFAPHAQ